MYNYMYIYIYTVRTKRYPFDNGERQGRASKTVTLNIDVQVT